MISGGATADPGIAPERVTAAGRVIAADRAIAAGRATEAGRVIAADRAQPIAVDRARATAVAAVVITRSRA
jgi:hypothetical protein